MSNEKLREALQDMIALAEQVMNLDQDEKARIQRAKALSTTEPEPTGMPELPEPDHMVNRWPTSHVYTINQTSGYGEQCWKAGYKQGVWADKPAVNQQLTTEPLDEREAFEKWAAPNRFDVGHKGEDGSYLGRASSIAWAGWQARAAMAKGVK